MKIVIPGGGEPTMLSRWAAYWASLILRMVCRAVSGTGREFRDGMTAQRAAALGPAPA